MNAEKPAFTCRTCLYFKQHYVVSSKNGFVMCPFGHCVLPRRKARRDNMAACRRYISKETAGSPPPSDPIH